MLMNLEPIFTRVGIVGTGAMGRGIAQLAAQAGSQVWLLDVQPGAAEAARSAIAQQWQRLADKGRMDAAQVAAQTARLQVAASVADLAQCGLVVEAIVERLDAKQALLASLEAVLAPGAVLASNT